VSYENLLVRAVLLLSMSSLSPVKAADTIHFLVAELPDRKNHNDSYVLPLSKQEDIDHARYLVSKYKLGYSSGDRTIVVANVGAAKDDINRNFLDPKFPKWSWQVSQFVNFQDASPEIGDGNPTWLEASDWSNGGQVGIGFWDYTVVSELGPAPLYLSIIPEGPNLQFYWSGIGTNYVYTLEGKEPLASTNWFPVLGAAWPLQTNHWTLPLADATARFYRFRSEQSPQ
jgi:hypothetical protein